MALTVFLFTLIYPLPAQVNAQITHPQVATVAPSGILQTGLNYAPSRFPDRTAEAQAALAYDSAQTACKASGGVFNTETAGCTYPPPPVPPAPVYVAPPNGSCLDWMAQAGISDMANAYKVIMFESGCRPGVMNAEGACGIPQALPCSKLPGYPNDPVVQLEWMQTYCYNRYGSWEAAWQHELNFHWY